MMMHLLFFFYLCLSQGKAHEEALTNIKEAIEGWFEVMESKQSFDRSHLIELSV